MSCACLISIVLVLSGTCWRFFFPPDLQCRSLFAVRVLCGVKSVADTSQSVGSIFSLPSPPHPPTSFLLSSLLWGVPPNLRHRARGGGGRSIAQSVEDLDPPPFSSVLRGWTATSSCPSYLPFLSFLPYSNTSFSLAFDCLYGVSFCVLCGSPLFRSRRELEWHASVSFVSFNLKPALLFSSTSSYHSLLRDKKRNFSFLAAFSG